MRVRPQNYKSEMAARKGNINESDIGERKL